MKNEKLYALSFFPHGGESQPRPGLLLDDDVVQVTAFKQAEDGRGYIIRLFEPTGLARATTISVPSMGLSAPIALKGFEIKTLRLDSDAATLTETSLMES